MRYVIVTPSTTTAAPVIVTPTTTTTPVIVDLDVISASESRWTSATVSTTFNTSASDDALPASYGDPRFFHFSAAVTLGVSTAEPASGSGASVGRPWRQAVARCRLSRSVSGGDRRAAPGEMPTVRLKARLNAASDS